MPDEVKDGQSAAVEPAAPAQATSTEPVSESVEPQHTEPAVETTEKPEKKEPEHVPYPRFKEVISEKNTLKTDLEREREERIRLEERLKAQEQTRQQQTQAQQPKWYSKAELQTLADNGQWSQAQVDEYYERQLLTRATAEAEQRAYERIRQEQAVQETRQTVTRELDDYRTLIPNAWDRGSAEHRQAASEYARLVQRLGYTPERGSAQDLALEAEALRAAFGPVDRIKQARQTADRTRETRETHREVGGGTVPEHVTSTGKDDPIKSLSAVERNWYARKIEQGVYKDWGAVRKERSYQNPRQPKSKQLA